MPTYLYLSETGYCVCENEDIYLKFSVPKKLASLLNVKTFDDGYVEIITNYGEDYIDLKAIADEIKLTVNFNDIKLLIRGPEHDF